VGKVTFKECQVCFTKMEQKVELKLVKCKVTLKWGMAR
jgi:hypothetical protein